MVTSDTASMAESLQDGRCPACGAGAEAGRQGLFCCPACGLARTGEPTDAIENSATGILPLSDFSGCLADGRILVRAPSGWANRIANYNPDHAVAGTPIAGDKGGAGYDAVLLVRHLERAPDPAGEMAAARELLKPGGLLYLDIGRDGPWTIPINAARRMIENAGFRVVRRIGRFSLRRRAPLRLLCRRY